MAASRTALLVAGGLAAATLTACSEDASATIAGEVVAGPPSLEVIGDLGFVLIPAGRIDVVVGEPRGGDVSAQEASDDEAHEAPEGGSWIPVHLAHDPYGAMAVPVGLTGGSPQPAQVALVVDGTTVSLGAPYRVVGEEGTADSGLDNVWVAVDRRPDEVESVQVAVTYDGLTQTLEPKTGAREAGVADPMYEQPTEPSDVGCPAGGFHTAGVRLDAACVVGPAQRSPYLPGAGWAEEGRSWLVVSAAVSIDKATAGRTSYDVTSIEPRLTVDGADPLPPDGKFGEVRHDPDRVSGTWAFGVAASGELSVRLELDLVLTKVDSDDLGPSTRRVTVARTVDLG